MVRGSRPALAVATGVLLLVPLQVSSSTAAEPGPTAVAVAGDFDSELGCASDWAPDCDQVQLSRRDNDGVWALTVQLPEGTYAYKAALNKSWDVSYGQHASPTGANIPLTVPAGGSSVTFLYDEVTHWITDTVAEPVATAAGSFQSELGCPADWSPDCLRSWLQDPDGDGTYTFTTTGIPAGDHEVKATLGMSWDVSYGAGGTAGGANIPFTVETDGATTTFSFDSASHVLTVYAGEPRPGLQLREAHWLTPGIIAWDLGADPASRTYQLAASPDGGLDAGETGITGGSTVSLTYDPAGLPAALRAAYPHLASLDVLRVPAAAVAKAGRLLRGQVAVAALNSAGTLVDATGLQIPGVLDSLYAARAGRADLGPVFRRGRPTLSVWAPTARTVSLELYASSTATVPTLVPMHRDDRTGVWSVTGKRAWKNRFYRYRVDVFAPDEPAMVTNSVTDPYSLALSTDSRLSQLVDLDDRDLAPRGWSSSTVPKAVASTRQEIQELHVRDFSIEDTTVPAADRGTYRAFAHSRSAGMKHLRELAGAGVTTVHLLPVFDFGGVPENRADQAGPPCDLPALAPDSAQQQACVAQVQGTDAYNWGYNPLHYTVPEGSYATRTDGSARTRQFREMVQSVHESGLRWCWTWSTTTPRLPVRVPTRSWTGSFPATTIAFRPPAPSPRTAAAPTPPPSTR